MPNNSRIIIQRYCIIYVKVLVFGRLPAVVIHNIISSLTESKLSKTWYIGLADMIDECSGWVMGFDNV